MFINLKTAKPAWLLSQDGDVTYSLHPPGEDQPTHTVPSFEFFSKYREATPEEFEANKPLRGSQEIKLRKTKPTTKAPRAKAAGGSGRKGRAANASPRAKSKPAAATSTAGHDAPPSRVAPPSPPAPPAGGQGGEGR